MKTVGVIIVDYRSDPLLDQALSSLERSDRINLNVVVIQNCPRFKPAPPPGGLKIQYVPQQTNLGFARAVNIAAGMVKSEYYLILNPDVHLLSGCVSVLYDFMEKNRDVAITVPKLLNADGDLQLSTRHFYDLKTIIFRRTPLGRMFPNHPTLRHHLMADWDHNSIRGIDWALGACMFIRAEAVGEEIFDPRFFLYFEDVDLCLRVKKNGWKVIYHPDAKAIHEHRQDSRKRPLSLVNLKHVMSWVKFIVKHRSISGIG